MNRSMAIQRARVLILETRSVGLTSCLPASQYGIAFRYDGVLHAGKQQGSKVWTSNALPVFLQKVRSMSESTDYYAPDRCPVCFNLTRDQIDLDQLRSQKGCASCELLTQLIKAYSPSPRCRVIQDLKGLGPVHRLSKSYSMKRPGRSVMSVAYDMSLSQMVMVNPGMWTSSRNKVRPGDSSSRKTLGN